jgi:hypothetical protein
MRIISDSEVIQYVCKFIIVLTDITYLLHYPALSTGDPRYAHNISI